MNTCCSPGAPASPGSPAPRPALRPARRTAREALAWALPAATIALVPKCPACVAAYAALLTGLSLSHAAATYTRWALIALSLAALGYLILSRARRALFRTANHPENPPCSTPS